MTSEAKAGRGEALRAALKLMLYIFDRGLPESSIGRRTCDEAIAALALPTPAKVDEKTGGKQDDE